MQEVISIRELFNIALPLVAMATVLVIYMAYRNNKLVQKMQDYKIDFYRQSVESQIAKLQDQLIVSTERFKDINHLLIEGQKAGKSTNSIDDKGFFSSLGVDTMEPVDKSLIFVLMPFNEKSLKSYQAMREVADKFGFKISRGDDVYHSASILNHIVAQIVKSRIIIADISGRNPNVFYELGIAHSLNKTVLIIANSLLDIPFDVSSTRVLMYDDVEDLKIRLGGWIVHSLDLEKK